MIRISENHMNVMSYPVSWKHHLNGQVIFRFSVFHEGWWETYTDYFVSSVNIYIIETSWMPVRCYGPSSFLPHIQLSKQVHDISDIVTEPWTEPMGFWLRMYKSWLLRLELMGPTPLISPLSSLRRHLRDGPSLKSRLWRGSTHHPVIVVAFHTHLRVLKI